jgi:hypothetical protein
MAAPVDTAILIAAIYNACWLVRHYQRGGRSSIGRAQRQQAILELGLVVRDTFGRTEDFEPLLIALFDGLHDKPPPPF